ncbi:MAG: hypothetical protein GY929_05035 [Actinomycetia bacterium]|nr:hypothetical protein [Actinomycetes bacterium]
MTHLDVNERRGARLWFAIGLATALMFLSHTLFIFGFGAASEDEPVFAGGLIGIAVGLVPGVFLVTAVVSRHERAGRASLLATALWFAVAVPIAVFDIPTGLVAGFGAGGIVALRRSGPQAVPYRVAAITLCVVYTFVVQRIVPAAGLMLGAVIPLAAIAIADAIGEDEAERLT